MSLRFLFFVVFLLTIQSSCRFSSDEPIEVSEETRTGGEVPQKPRWTAPQVLVLLPDSFFVPLRQTAPQEYARIAPKAARKALANQYPLVHETCLTQTLETKEERKRRETEYNETHSISEIQLCVYPLPDDHFVVYVQVVRTCWGNCEQPIRQEALLGYCKRYDRQNDRWMDYTFAPIEDEKKSAAHPLYLLTPKGLCLRSAVESFTGLRHRSVQSQTDMARMDWEMESCRVWTGKSFE